MLVSMVGIIWIQTSWISSSIAEQEKDFEVRVNEALNTVNDSIDIQEVELFLKREFGGVDSLVKEFIVLPDMREEAILEINVKQDDAHKNIHRDEMKIIHSPGKQKGERRIIRHDSMDMRSVIITDDSLSDSAQNIFWSEKVEAIYSGTDSLRDREHIVKKRDRVKSVVQRYTLETLLTGKLSDRIDPKDLKDKIGKALKKEGITGSFAFAVKNDATGAFEPDFVSKNYDSTRTKSAFSKELFQSDRSNKMNYTLYVQTDDSSNFVWARVWKMTALSILFTVLILLSFGYALYFIFKQKKVSQIKNDFINNMTHELKTPLASISIATASINHPQVIKNPEEVRRLTRLIEDEKDRINSHVERVLDTAALDSGELKLSTDQLSIHEILVRSIKNVELALQQVNGVISLPEDEEIILVGDAFHLTNAFTNILDNSIKYRSDQAPNIVVTVEQNNSTVSVAIQDNGIGMTTKQQKQAFEKFYRAETGNIHNRKGFGLGLSYVQSVVKKHHGSVEIKSKLEEGTTVIVELPKS